MFYINLVTILYMTLSIIGFITIVYKINKTVNLYFNRSNKPVSVKIEPGHADTRVYIKEGVKTTFYISTTHTEVEYIVSALESTLPELRNLK